ncbi:MAG TPA: hypothetical protein VNN80_20595 [Polyangiaceae bacterium]|nr:hypothetical protein [Polyangiaceae bacterium]
MSARKPGPLAALLLGGALLACTAPTRPPAMARAAEVGASPAAVEAETWAPQAHGHAKQLEQRAEEALAEGDAARAALLAEQAIAAHEHAWVLTRLARAERRRLSAEAELTEQRRALEALQAEQQRLSAEAAGLELQVQAAGGALPAAARATSTAERQPARRQATAALATQARLLCVGVRLLGEASRVEQLVARLDELERSLASSPASAPLETAASLRADCLAALSEVRRRNVAPAAQAPRAAASARHAPPPADVVLDQLSAIGATPSRDERGVSVALRSLFGGDGNLTADARQELASIAKVVDAHPDFPLMLVGHGDGRDMARQLAALQTELGRNGAVAVEVQSAGDRLPLLPPSSAAARERNARIELIFVAPGF